MAVVTRAGRARPRSAGFELSVWYLIRLSGLALFVLALAHFSIVHFVSDPAEQTSEWIFGERWDSLVWRTLDWLMLQMVVFHAFLGMRTVLSDYLKGGLADRDPHAPVPARLPHLRHGHRRRAVHAGRPGALRTLCGSTRTPSSSGPGAPLSGPPSSSPARESPPPS